ncbi:MAG TPA: NADH-quinone oxidoreductase subunit NuoG [Aggregatilineales bacterium]|nr:NADH-quinone oxidoreductase subunit NuoG [Aggregatilineales bacterium]
MADTVRVFIDDVEYPMEKGANLVDAAKSIGNDIPVFCYHPKLEPVGMCRMCLIELGQVQSDPTTKEFQVGPDGKPVIRWQPKLQTACTTTVTNGMTVRTATKLVQDARKDVIEFLLTSHPLDCPICDKGGECPLQNLTLRYGSGTSRFNYDEKLHLDKHYPLGDLIYLDRERCIQCARCTRFQEELVGDDVLAFSERGRSIQIMTTSNPPFDTYFSGNTTDICPVGALTTADFRFGARPWELTEVPSICPHCPVGCNVSLTTRPDRDNSGNTVVKRVMPRQNESVNEIWMCDKGRFGHHFSRHAERITTPMIRKGSQLVETSWDEALGAIAARLKGNDSVGAIAGAMLSNEDLWELRRLVGGTEGKGLGVWPYRMTGADVTAKVGLPSGSNFKHVGAGSLVIVVASDIEEEAPVWYLRIKGARDRGARVVVVNARSTEMDRWGRSVRYNYGGEVEALNGIEIPSDTKHLVIVVGADGLDRARHGALMHAAGNILIKSGKAGQINSGVLAVWPGANTQGAFDLGFSSETTEEMLKNRPDVLFLADADVLGEDALSADLLKKGFNVVSDLFLTETARQADVVLPRQSFAERDGTFTNGERRVQRFYTAQTPLDGTRPDWKIYGDIGARMGKGKAKLSAAAVMQEITRNVPLYADMSYTNLAKVEKQFPEITGLDPYYGGTAYHNRGGLGIRWNVEAATLSVPAFDTAKSDSTTKGIAVGKDELLVVPITVLYDRKPTFAASDGLMHSHIPAPHVILNSDDAKKMGIADGETVRVEFGNGQGVEVAASVLPHMPAGAVLLPRNLSEQPVPAVPVAGSVRKVEVMANA